MKTLREPLAARRPANVTVISLGGGGEIDAAEVLAGLGSEPKRLSPKLFYDARGSELFNAICETAAYYPTRTERGILADRRVIVLDEPLDGLSDDSLDRLRDLFITLRAFDRAILIASRDAAALHRIADRVTPIDRGRVRRIGAARPTTPVAIEAVFHLAVQHGAEHVLAVFPTATALGKGVFAVRVSGLAVLNLGLRELLERGALIASLAPANARVEPNALPPMAEAAS